MKIEIVIMWPIVENEGVCLFSLFLFLFKVRLGWVRKGVRRETLRVLEIEKEHTIPYFLFARQAIHEIIPKLSLFWEYMTGLHVAIKLIVNNLWVSIKNYTNMYVNKL